MKVKLKDLKKFQIYFLDFRLLLFQPENVGKINLYKKLQASKSDVTIQGGSMKM